MIRAWVVEDHQVRATTAEEATRACTRGANVWIDIENDEPEARQLLTTLGIHPLAIEDIVTEVNRPKVDDYGSYLYLVLHSARWDEDRPAMRELDVVLSRHFLVTYHDGSTRSVTAAHDVVQRRPELLEQCPARLLHFILDLLVDHYMPIVDRIAEEIDELEETLFDPRQELAYERIIHLKRGMSALRRIVGPQRDTVLALTRDEFQAVPAELRPYLRDVYDRMARVSDLLDSFRDESATLLELHTSLAANRLNEVIKRLTVIATVGLPLTVITSYYGMNFKLPEYAWDWGWIYVLVLLLATGAATWIFLRWRRWL